MTNRIRTNRLLLRPLTPADAPVLAALVNDYQVSRWLSVVPYPYSVKDAEEFISQIATDWDMAISRGTQLLGVVGISNGSLGYWLGREFHGLGYMSEAAVALVGAWFDAGNMRLHSGYFTGNAASERVLDKLGFAPDGVERVHARAQDAEVDLQRMLLTRAAWQARHG